eukprot:4333353-Amphidinium_carterae.1
MEPKSGKALKNSEIIGRAIVPTAGTFVTRFCWRGSRFEDTELVGGPAVEVASTSIGTDWPVDLRIL